MNKLDKDYQNLLQDILDNGVTKGDRTGTGTKSVFGRQIRHKMSDGFPILTTKEIHFPSVVAELLWFLKGSTDIRDLWNMNCNIWNGDWYKHYKTSCSSPYSLKEMKEHVKNGSKHFHDQTFSLGPVYGKQWRNWKGFSQGWHDVAQTIDSVRMDDYTKGIDQIKTLIETLKTNPDSRRMMVNAWNVGEIDDMVLPPCHYGFQIWTRESTREEKITNPGKYRVISLMWNQRSVDTFLGLPFNIASYGLLLEILAKEVNMIPGELIGNLGDTHLYSNHIEQAKEQIGGKLTIDERFKIWFDRDKPNRDVVDNFDTLDMYSQSIYLDVRKVPIISREPFELPKLMFKTHLKEFDSIIDILRPVDFVLDNYKSHGKIKAPLSN